ncbi:N-6 DNA methylase [Streptomyces sp. IBSBF 2950]|uniref:N-6 DNA methylase n=1 Tax=Streptomyces sp. IBSBF 2950 TaxID=2903528 RepID=UPI002FDBE4D1
MSVTPEAALAACARAAEAHAQNAEWRQALHFTVRSLIDRLAEAKLLPPPKLERPHVQEAEDALDTLGPLEGWHVMDLGEVHQQLLERTVTRHSDGTATVDRKDLAVRAILGSWYTPPQVAEAMCRLSIGPQLDRLAQHPDPGNLLQVLSIDPACGAGVFLIEAARLIAGRLAERVSGVSPAPAAHMKHALPLVMRECIFGVDIDPVAVDLARMALWLEIDGREPFGFMDRNVIVGNALDDEMPPAFTERRGDLPTAAERRRGWADAHG